MIKAKKFMSLFLALLMLVSLCSVQVFAAEPGEAPAGESEAEPNAEPEPEPSAEPEPGAEPEPEPSAEPEPGAEPEPEPSAEPGQEPESNELQAAADVNLNSPTPPDSGAQDFLIDGDVLVEYKGQGGDIAVPAGIKTIGSGVFSDRKDITSVTLPEGLKSIGDNAFYNSSLSSINLPEGLLNIGDFAFYNTALSQIQLPQSIESIGSYGFAENPQLSGVLVLNLKSDLGKGAFQNCSSISSLSLGGSSGSYSVPEDGFAFCTGLKSLELAPGLVNIGDRAFCGCSGIVNSAASVPGQLSLSFAAGVPCRVGSKAFANCVGLSSLKTNSADLSFGPHSFYGCSGIKKLNICASSIEDYAFQGLSSLENIRLGNHSACSVGLNVFKDCGNVKRINLAGYAPNITYSGENFMQDMHRLQGIEVEDKSCIEDVKAVLSPYLPAGSRIFDDPGKTVKNIRALALYSSSMLLGWEVDTNPNINTYEIYDSYSAYGDDYKPEILLGRDKTGRIYIKDLGRGYHKLRIQGVDINGSTICTGYCEVKIDVFKWTEFEVNYRGRKLEDNYIGAKDMSLSCRLSGTDFKLIPELEGRKYSAEISFTAEGEDVPVYSFPAAVDENGTINEELNLPQSMADGKYYLKLSVTDPEGYDDFVRTDVKLIRDHVPEPPQRLELKQQEGGIMLSWYHSFDPAVECYDIYRSVGQQPFEKISSRDRVNENYQYLDSSSFVNGEIYRYYVVAYNLFRVKSADSEIVQLRYEDINPEYTVKQAVYSKSVELSWQLQGAANIASYNIYRDGVLIKNQTEMSFRDSGLTEGQKYSYCLEAVYTDGSTGAKSKPIDIIPAGIGIESVLPVKGSYMENSRQEIVFKGTGISFEAVLQDSGNLEELKAAASSFSAVITQSDGSTQQLPFSFKEMREGKAVFAADADISAYPEGRYKISLKLRDRDLTETSLEGGEFIICTTQPTAPTGISAKSEGKGVKLSWTPSEAAVSEYIIYRASYGSDKFLEIGRSEKPEYMDASGQLIPGSRYSYYVTVLNPADKESAASELVHCEVNMYGDIDNDGIISKEDYLLIMQYLAGMDVQINLSAADYNLDGSISSADYVSLMQEVYKKGSGVK